MRLLFVTPAFQRYTLSAIVYAQRADCIARLAARGVEAQCVVISDDENLDLARAHGFDVIERDNEYLGRRWNDGYVHAADNGYTHVAPIGSDSWVDPDYFLPALDPDSDTLLTSLYYSLVDENGEKLAPLEIEHVEGVGPHTFPTKLLPPGNRPVGERLPRGCDHSLLQGLRGPRRTRIQWEWRNRHALQYIGFRSADLQLNPYEPLAKRYGVSEHDDPWTRLAECYPPALVEQARQHYASQPRFSPPEPPRQPIPRDSRAARLQREQEARAEARRQRWAAMGRTP